MKKGVPIEGRVVDAEGRPVAGALVLSTEQRWDLHSEPAKFAVTTDAKGHFRTGQVKAGEWFLVARARGHAPGERSVKIGTAVPQVEITLGRPHAFHGRVIDPGGQAGRRARSSTSRTGAAIASWGSSSTPTPTAASAGMTPRKTS